MENIEDLDILNHQILFSLILVLLAFYHSLFLYLHCVNIMEFHNILLFFLCQTIYKNLQKTYEKALKERKML